MCISRQRKSARHGVIAFFLAVAACGGATTATTSSPDAGGDRDAALSPPECSADAGTCTSSPSCCVFEGRRVNLKAKCLFPAEPTILNCVAQKCPFGTDVNGCYQRTVMTGTVETYRTDDRFLVSYLGPDFKECPTDVGDAVAVITNPCP